MVLTDELWPIHVCLCALYLRGLPRPAACSARRVLAVERALRLASPALGSAAGCLRQAGFPEEALILDAPGQLTSAELVAPRALSLVSAGYPSLWPLRLRGSVPGALWVQGEPSVGPWFAVAGSRTPCAASRRLTAEVARAALAAGFGIVSGGAVGCDSVAAEVAQRAGGPLLTLLPHGFPAPAGFGAFVAAAAPREPFSTPLAMERNALIYAAADAAVVVQPRLRQGGSWHGAADALRRRLTRLFVAGPPSPGVSGLAALGAEPLLSPAELPARLAVPPIPPSLFEALAG